MLTYVLDAAHLGATWLLLAAVGVITILWLWSETKPRYSGTNLPPFPAPRRFLTGHLHWWVMKDPLITLDELYRRVGPVFSLDFSGMLLVFVNGYDAIKEIAVKNGAYVKDRPMFSWKSHLQETDEGLFEGKGHNWKVQRSTSLAILRGFGIGKSLMAERIAEEVALYTDKLASFQGNPVDISVPTTVSVSNVICSIAVGKRFDYDDTAFLRLLENLDLFFRKVPLLSIFEAAPFLQKLPGDVFGFKKFANSIVEVSEDFCKRYIRKVKETFSNSTDPTNFISAYLEKMYQDPEKSLDEKNLTAIIREFFYAGTDTTSTTISWCVLYCLHHPEVQEKIFDEISASVETHHPPEITDRGKLRYLEAVIKETSRLSSVAHLGQRKADADIEINGYTIPEGTSINLNFHSVLHDPAIWGDPENFRPERFLDPDGNLLSPEELIPFGLGRRVCVGEHLAKMELFLFLSAMFQRFRFLPESSVDKLPAVEPEVGFILKPKPHKVRIVPRVHL